MKALESLKELFDAVILALTKPIGL